MTAIYRLTRLDASTRGGMNQAIDAEIRGVAKTNDVAPYTIANEVIAARIGTALGLPIPSGVVAEGDGKKLYYLSLDVSFEGKKLPPIVPADFAATEPLLAAGIVAFDILIANGDRNSENLARDPAFTPPRVSVFDHGHALFGTSDPTGLDRLRQATDDLGCAGGSFGTPCVLLDHISDAPELKRWADRIAALPPFVFEDACAAAATGQRLGITQAEAVEGAEWLVKRAQRVWELVCDNQKHFPRITQWSLDSSAR